MRRIFILTLLSVSLVGCSTHNSRQRHGYYKNDGPPTRPRTKLHTTPNAIPRIEPLARGPNKPYVVFGKRYVPDTRNRPYTQQGLASWYGKKFHGKLTASGEPYNMYAMTAAHRTLPIPCYARVTNARNGRSIIVRINDRGPFHAGRIIDLSYVAAHKLDILKSGSQKVTVKRLLPHDIRQMNTH
jgi:rare lipoprotein A